MTSRFLFVSHVVLSGRARTHIARCTVFLHTLIRYRTAGRFMKK